MVINIIAPVEPARVYHLGIIQQAAHPPPEQVKRNVAVINIIAPVEPARVYQQDIIQRAEVPPPEQVKRNVAVINIIAPVEPARVYHLGIIPQAAHPPPEQVKRNAPPAHIAVVELNTIARLAIPTLPPVQQPKPNAINRAPRHAHGRHAHLMRPVPTAVHQPAAHNIMAVHAVLRLQHVQSAYRVIPAITKAAAVVRHAVAINIIAPVEPARVYHLGIIPQAAHPPPEQVKRNVAVINIIAVVVCAIVYQQGIIQQVEALLREQVKRNAPVQHIASVGLNMIVQNQLKMQISLLVIGIGHQMVFTIN